MPFPKDGIRFLFSLYFHLVPVQLVTFALLTFFESRYGDKLPFTLTPVAKYLLALATSIIHIFVQRFVTSVKTKRNARRLGAQLPPVLPYRQIGGLDILKDMLHEAEHGYLATYLTKYFEEMGHTFLMKIMGDGQVSVWEPFSSDTKHRLMKTLVTLDLDYRTGLYQTRFGYRVQEL